MKKAMLTNKHNNDLRRYGYVDRENDVYVYMYTKREHPVRLTKSNWSVSYIDTFPWELPAITVREIDVYNRRTRELFQRGLMVIEDDKTFILRTDNKEYYIIKKDTHRYQDRVKTAVCMTVVQIEKALGYSVHVVK